MAGKRGSRASKPVNRRIATAGPFKGRVVVPGKSGNRPGSGNARARSEIRKGNYTGRALSKREAESAGMGSSRGGAG